MLKVSTLRRSVFLKPCCGIFMFRQLLTIFLLFDADISSPENIFKNSKTQGFTDRFSIPKKKNFQKCDFLEGFEGFFHFDVKTKKLYSSSLILLASKKSQKSGSACP